MEISSLSQTTLSACNSAKEMGILIDGCHQIISLDISPSFVAGTIVSTRDAVCQYRLTHPLHFQVSSYGLNDVVTNYLSCNLVTLLDPICDLDSLVLIYPIPVHVRLTQIGPSILDQPLRCSQALSFGC